MNGIESLSVVEEKLFPWRPELMETLSSRVLLLIPTNKINSGICYVCGFNLDSSAPIFATARLKLSVLSSSVDSLFAFQLAVLPSRLIGFCHGSLCNQQCLMTD